MVKDSSKPQNYTKICIFWCSVVFVLVVTMFLSLVHFKGLKTTGADSAKIEQTLAESTAASDSNQPKLEMAEKADSTVRNTAEETSASLANHNWEFLRSSMRRDSESITVTKNTDGSSAAFLNGTFRTVSVAKRLPDGRLVTRCFESFDALEKFMTSTAKKSAAMESK